MSPTLDVLWRDAINDALLWEYLGKAYEQGFFTAFRLWMDVFSAYPLE